MCAVASIAFFGCGDSTPTDGDGSPASADPPAEPAEPADDEVGGDAAGGDAAGEGGDASRDAPPKAAPGVVEVLHAVGGERRPFHVVVRSDGLDVDNGGWFALMDDVAKSGKGEVQKIRQTAASARRKDETAKVSEKGLSAASQNHLVPALTDVLTGLVKEEKLFAKIAQLDRPRLGAEIEIAADVPYAKVVDVLYTLSKSEVMDWGFIVRGPSGNARIASTPPKIAVVGLLADDCPALSVYVAEDGLTLRTGSRAELDRADAKMRSMGLLRAIDSDAKAEEAESSTDPKPDQHGVLLDTDKTCPTVKPKAGAPDLAALARLPTEVAVGRRLGLNTGRRRSRSSQDGGRDAGRRRR